MASSDAGDFLRMVEVGLKLCLLVVGLIVLPFAIAAHRERLNKQAAAMTAKARELGFEFSKSANSRLAGMVRHLDSLDVNNGRDRYAFNVVEGSLDGHPIAVFDYHYATSGDWWWPPNGRLTTISPLSWSILKGNFLELQKELVNTEDRIQAARRFYNGNVRDYRNLREAFPSNIIANMFDFEDRSFFAVQASVRIAPDVDLA